MKFEGLEQNTLSFEEQETLDELLPITANFFESSEKPEGAYRDMEKLKKQLKNPEKYYLWSLLSPELSSDRGQYEFFDTEDGKIKRFIESLDTGVKELDFETAA